MYKSYSMETCRKNTDCRYRTCSETGQWCCSYALRWYYSPCYCYRIQRAERRDRFLPVKRWVWGEDVCSRKDPGRLTTRGEGKASEHAILTSRVIDRPMRPLFPKDYRNDVTLVDMVMSVDPECNPEIPAMLGSSIATCISDIPFDGPCATTQVGMIDGEFIINRHLHRRQFLIFSLRLLLQERRLSWSRPELMRSRKIRWSRLSTRLMKWTRRSSNSSTRS